MARRRRTIIGRGAALVALAAASSGCSETREAGTPVPTTVASPPESVAGGTSPAAEHTPAPATSDVDAGADPASEEPPAAPRCAAPPGISTIPETIGQAVSLMNSLPRPTSLDCFIESLARPLEVYFTRSQLSAQPADGDDSPRIFIVNGDLFMSIVPSGFASHTLELGLRTTPERAIRGEIAFPLLAPVTPLTMAEHIEFGERASFCGFCHGREARVTDTFLGELGLESDVIAPNPVDELSIEAVRELASACDPQATDERCSRLRALFDHGELTRSGGFDAPL